MKELVLLLQAETDIQRAYNYLEDQRPDLGEEFLRELDRQYALIVRHSEIAPLFRNRYRRKLLQKFAYGISYTVEPRRVIVGTVQCTLQEPKRIARILDDLNP